MISQRLFLLVLATLVCRELASSSASVLPRSAMMAALGATLGFGLLFKVSVIRLLTQQAGGDRFARWQRSCRDRRRIETAWVITLPAVLLATGWGQMLNHFQSTGLPQTAAVIGWFLPSLALIALLELTAAQFEEYCAQAVASDGISPNHWAEDWLARMRLGDMASLATCIAPIVLIAAFSDVATLIRIELLTPELKNACALLAVASIVFLLPQWLGLWMGVVNLPDGLLSRRIHEQLDELGLKGIKPMWLPSRGRWPGAAVVGWFPRFRQLWLGDALVERLSPRELDMVVMHELAHVTRMHFMWRLLPILAVVVLVGGIWLVWPVERFSETGRIVAASLVAGVTLLGGLKRTAHACEFDADLTACALASQVCDWARENPGRAAQEMASALVVLLADSPEASEATWLHPSLTRRTENLQKLTGTLKKIPDAPIL